MLHIMKKNGESTVQIFSDTQKMLCSCLLTKWDFVCFVIVFAVTHPKTMYQSTSTLEFKRNCGVQGVCVTYSKFNAKN